MNKLFAYFLIIIIFGFANPAMLFSIGQYAGYSSAQCCCADLAGSPQCACGYNSNAAGHNHSNSAHKTKSFSASLSECGNFADIQFDLPAFKFLQLEQVTHHFRENKDLSIPYLLTLNSTDIPVPDKPPKIA